jgi:hypothetical protein
LNLVELSNKAAHPFTFTFTLSLYDLEQQLAFPASPAGFFPSQHSIRLEHAMKFSNAPFWKI